VMKTVIQTKRNSVTIIRIDINSIPHTKLMNVIKQNNHFVSCSTFDTDRLVLINYVTPTTTQDDDVICLMPGCLYNYELQCHSFLHAAQTS
jgi:hypothetical protein